MDEQKNVTASFIDIDFASSVTQGDITWNFDKEYQYGQFANGDHWVLIPPGESVGIIGITPESTTNSSSNVINGSMLNPAVNPDSQGFDETPGDFPYDASLNIARGINSNTPLVISTESSLISTISKEWTSSNHSYVKSAEILTLVSSVPADGSFRPAYVGNDKTIHYNISNLHYSVLEKLEPVADTYDLSTVEDMFKGVWLEFQTGPNCSSIHPADNMPWYGREIARNVGIGALMLHLNFSNEQKKNLLIYYTQLGIDLYGIVQNGGRWTPNGGHEGGRKWPILFAGIVLNVDGMKAIGEKSGDYLYENGFYEGNRPSDYIDFGEDGQTFYITQRDIDRHHDRNYQYDVRPGYGYPMADVDYLQENLGLPEWGINHSHTPVQDSADWDTNYRATACRPFSGFVLAALIMENSSSARTLWNHDALFDYQYRYMHIEGNGVPDPFGGTYDHDNPDTNNRSIDAFTTNMWDAYIETYYFGPYGP
jgi:hypothetical protein